MEQIQTICLLKIILKGFKRFKETYEVNLDTITYVMGGNGQGKTTIADAIAFAFCGTPLWGEKSCDRLKNPESAVLSVEVRFVDENGEVHTLVRQKDERDSIIVLDKNKIRQADMERIFAEKDIFLSILNPLYFLEKIAENGREFLQKLLPPVAHETILAGLTEHSRSLLEKESIPDPEYYIKQKRTALKEIKETEIYLDGQIDILKKQQKEAEQKLDELLGQGKAVAERKKELTEKRYKGIDVDSLKRQAEGADREAKRREIQSRRTAIEKRQYQSEFQEEIGKAKAKLEMRAGRYKQLEQRLSSLRLGDSCPTCHVTVTQDTLPLMQKGIKEDMLRTFAEGKTAREALTELFDMEKKSCKHFENFKAEDLQKADAELAALQSDTSLAVIQEKIRLGNLSEEEYKELLELDKAAAAYTLEVEKVNATAQNPEKIKRLEQQATDNSKRKAELLNLIHAAQEYAAKKAELMLSQLTMHHAAIKLFEIVKTTGEVKNVFKCTYDGRDYSWLSASEKIKAGLEISGLLKQITGLCYPVYIDNAESITTKLNGVDGQVILAYARNCELTVRIPQKPNREQEAA